MAEKRMFSKKIIDSDAFLDMPLSTQCLYFHLAMRADDEGFINNPKKISRMIGCGEDDLKLLVAKRFILPFESGVVVIKHWLIHNTIRKDRVKETLYKNEKSLLSIKENGTYTTSNITQKIECQPNDNQMTTECQPNVSIDKIRLDKNRLDKISIDIPSSDDDAPISKPKKPVKHKYGEYKHVLLTDREKEKLVNEYGELETEKAITYLDESIEMKGYKYKSHYLAMKKWVFDAIKNNGKGYQKQKAAFTLSNGVETNNPFIAMLDESEER